MCVGSCKGCTCWYDPECTFWHGPECAFWYGPKCAFQYGAECAFWHGPEIVYFFAEFGGREDLRQLGPDVEGGERAPERVVRGCLQMPKNRLVVRCDGKDCQS